MSGKQVAYINIIDSDGYEQSLVLDLPNGYYLLIVDGKEVFKIFISCN